MYRIPTILAALVFVFSLTAQSQGQQPFPEWTIFNDGNAGTVKIIGTDGATDHEWQFGQGSGHMIYLMPGGNLLRCTSDPSIQPFGTGGVGGRIILRSWDGTLLWNYLAAGTDENGNDYVQHHDCEILPNGNIMFIAWERHTQADLIAHGRDPANAPSEIWSEAIYEIDPQPGNAANIVWIWRVWDHLIQDFDPSLPNFGSPADHPEKIDINYSPDGAIDDWLHFNAIDYNAELDQFIVSSTRFDEFWVISKNPADSGDILYRYGNPEAYGRGTVNDKVLWGQHDVQWIEPGLDGEGRILVFNNGRDPNNPRDFSSVDEIITPVQPDSSYPIQPGQAFEPSGPVWSHADVSGNQFFSTIMSSAQRLPNGNTLFNLGRTGEISEVDANGILVWQGMSQPFTFRAKRLGIEDSRIEGLLWEDYQPAAFSLRSGFLVSGGLPELLESDDQRMVVAQPQGDILIDFNSDVTFDDTDQIYFFAESSVLLPAQSRNPVTIEKSVEMFNYTTGTWDVIQTVEGALIDSTMSVVVDADDYLEPGTGTVEARLRYRKFGLARGMRALIDEVHWKAIK
ncbi:MAG: aryl-sulfate sulfotransferase [Planctomycetota bacterium]